LNLFAPVMELSTKKVSLIISLMAFLARIILSHNINPVFDSVWVMGNGNPLTDGQMSKLLIKIKRGMGVSESKIILILAVDKLL